MRQILLMILGLIAFEAHAANEASSRKLNCHISVTSTDENEHETRSHYKIPSASQAECEKASRLYAENFNPKKKFKKTVTYKWSSK